MDDLLQVGDHWYIPATSSRTDDRTRVLKHGDTFALFDRYGDVQTIGNGEQGIFHEGTRFLSRQELLLNGRRPLLLNSMVKRDNSLLAIDLTNQDIYRDDMLLISKGTLHIFRGLLLWQGVCYQQLRVTNHGLTEVAVELSLCFGADFSDIFEVRGVKRAVRGETTPPVVTERDVVLRYKGLDGVARRTRVTAVPPPARSAEGRFDYDVVLAPQAGVHLYSQIHCEGGDETRAVANFSNALDLASSALNAPLEEGCTVVTSNDRFNEWLARSSSDLRMLITETAHGPYPYAGVPWFSTAFGRDGLITGLQYLWVDPSLARGVLQFLAAHQATRTDAPRDAEPGKILHETREGEMAALREIPFGHYYGSVDSTPLFVMLAGAYYQRTLDKRFIKQIWPNIKRALAWIDKYGDADSDGFVEYSRRSREGLVQQGWKDSEDSISYADGRLVEGPVALCEVQAYTYAAKNAAAEIAELLGDKKLAAQLRTAAQELKTRFNRAFWCPELKTYAIALDGEKRQCAVASSNAGHALFGGIATPEYAKHTAQKLMGEDCFSGWGVRTLSSSAARYNPMSYHNGSIWPHDNSLIAMGLARYGMAEQADRIFSAMFDASNAMESDRLPELFCGFSRRHGEGPVRYPVACSPQAWASAAVFYLLQASLGLEFTAEEPGVALREPRLPAFLDWIEIRNLQALDERLTIRLRREGKLGVQLEITGDQKRVEVG